MVFASLTGVGSCGSGFGNATMSIEVPSLVGSLMAAWSVPNATAMVLRSSLKEIRTPVASGMQSSSASLELSQEDVNHVRTGAFSVVVETALCPEGAVAGVLREQ